MIEAERMARGVERLGPRFEGMAADGQLVLDRLGLAPGARVLDVGTGVGNFAIFLALSGFEVTTGEPADDHSLYAGHDWAAHAEAVGVADQIRFVPFAADRMPFETGAFDAVFFFGVLHHIDEAAREATFAEALRVARPGAHVCYFEPSAETLTYLWEQDPDHPEAARPAEHAGGLVPEETRLTGRMMDIYLYRLPRAG